MIVSISDSVFMLSTENFRRRHSCLMAIALDSELRSLGPSPGQDKYITLLALLSLDLLRGCRHLKGGGGGREREWNERLLRRNGREECKELLLMCFARFCSALTRFTHSQAKCSSPTRCMNCYL